MINRRRVLAVGAGGTAALLAGCNTNDQPSPDEGDGEAASYLEWVADPDGPYTSVSARELAALEAVGYFEDTDSDALWTIPYADISLHLTAGAVGTTQPVVVQGEFTAETARSGIEEDLELTDHQDGPYREFERATAQDGELVVALREGSAVVGPAAQVETIIDAGTGEGPRIVDAHDDVTLLMDELGTGEIVQADILLDREADTPFPPGLLGSGNRLSVDEETTSIRVVSVYETADQINESGQRSALESGNVSDVEIETDGRVIVATGSIPTAEL